MTITIERPKEIDLDELFELRLLIAPGFAGVEQLPRKRIEIGQRLIVFSVDRFATINGASLIWPSKMIWADCGGPVHMVPGDTLAIGINWHI